MAPNQKHKLNAAFSVSTAEADLLLVKPKQFPTLTSLTDASAEPKQEHSLGAKQGIAPTVLKSPVASDPYWNWPSTKATKDAPKDLFSASFLEASLLAEAKRLASRAASEGVVIIRAEHRDDAYWDEDSLVRSEVNQAVSDRTGYWDWPQEEGGCVATLILQEELARHQVSAQRMEERLVEEAQTRKHYLPQAKAEHDDFWNWETPSTVRADPGTKTSPTGYGTTRMHWRCRLSLSLPPFWSMKPSENSFR